MEELVPLYSKLFILNQMNKQMTKMLKMCDNLFDQNKNYS